MAGRDLVLRIRVAYDVGVPDERMGEVDDLATARTLIATLQGEVTKLRQCATLSPR
jgi:hypothetical protein